MAREASARQRSNIDRSKSTVSTLSTLHKATTMAKKRGVIDTSKAIKLGLFVLLLSLDPTDSFGVLRMSSKEIYGVPKSGWTRPEWNWGSAMGTGHDCAAISRRRYATVEERKDLVQLLLDGRGPPFEEVKLVLALAWQAGRWDGSDGGRGGYGDVLEIMAKAQRYEVGDEDECSRLLVEDMKARFELLRPEENDIKLMISLTDEANVDTARRKCAGLVLKAMGYVQNG